METVIARLLGTSCLVSRYFCGARQVQGTRYRGGGGIGIFIAYSLYTHPEHSTHLSRASYLSAVVLHQRDISDLDPRLVKVGRVEAMRCTGMI